MTQPIMKREERNKKHCNSRSVLTSAAMVWIILGIFSAMSLSTISSPSLLFCISLVKYLCSNALINSASFKLSSYRPFLAVDKSQDRMVLVSWGVALCCDVLELYLTHASIR